MAEGTVSLQHQLIESEPVDGGTMVTLYLTLKNTDVTPLDSVVLGISSPETIPESIGNTLAIGTLTPGIDTNQFWSFSIKDTEQINSIFDGDIYFTINALSGAEPVHIDAVSIVGAK